MRSTTNMTLATMVNMALALNHRVQIGIEPMTIEVPVGWSVPVIETKQEVEAAVGGASAPAVLNWKTVEAGASLVA